MWKEDGLAQQLMEYYYHPRNIDKWIDDE